MELMNVEEAVAWMMAKHQAARPTYEATADEAPPDPKDKPVEPEEGEDEPEEKPVTPPDPKPVEPPKPA
jgi:hypothetical protein